MSFPIFLLFLLFLWVGIRLSKKLDRKIEQWFKSLSKSSQNVIGWTVIFISFLSFGFLYYYLWKILHPFLFRFFIICGTPLILFLYGYVFYCQLFGEVKENE